jgi:hypothetical protein
MVSTWLRLIGATIAEYLRALRRDRALQIATFGAFSANLIAIAICAAIILLPRLWDIHLDLSERWDLALDNGYPEMVMYATTLLTAGALFYTSLRRRAPWLLFFALLFVIAFVDDAMQYHEIFGDYLAVTLDLPSFGGLRPQDTGELTAWALAGLLLVVPFVAAWRAQRPYQDGEAMVMFVLLGGLVFCGVVFDMLQILYWYGNIGTLLLFLEDGGEMLVMALTFSFAFSRALAARRAYGKSFRPEPRFDAPAPKAYHPFANRR